MNTTMTIPFTFGRARATHPGRSRRRARGFTLTEILLAIALVVIVAAVAVTEVDKTLENGKEEAAQLFVTQSLETPLLSYKMAMGHYPTTEQGIQALVACPEGESAMSWKGPYLNTSEVPLDPWKNPYHYAYPSTHGQASGKYDLWSTGASGSDGAPDNIGNWQPPS
jgi:general secretion pathway protein G